MDCCEPSKSPLLPSLSHPSILLFHQFALLWLQLYFILFFETGDNSYMLTYCACTWGHFISSISLETECTDFSTPPFNVVLQIHNHLLKNIFSDWVHFFGFELFGIMTRKLKPTTFPLKNSICSTLAILSQFRFKEKVQHWKNKKGVVERDIIPPIKKKKLTKNWKAQKENTFFFLTVLMKEEKKNGICWRFW